MSGNLTLKIVPRKLQPRKKFKLTEGDVNAITEYSRGSTLLQKFLTFESSKILFLIRFKRNELFEALKWSGAFKG